MIFVGHILGFWNGLSVDKKRKKLKQKPKPQIQPGNGEVVDERQEANQGAFATPALHPFSLWLTRPSQALWMDCVLPILTCGSSNPRCDNYWRYYL